MKDKTAKNYPVELRAALKQGDFLIAAKYLRKIHEEAPETFDTVLSLFKIGRRRAYYLISLEKQLSKLNLDNERLRSIGSTKLQIVAPHMTPDNCESLLLLAERFTGRELSQKLRNERLVKGERSVLLYFSPTQYKIFIATLLANGAEKAGNGLRGKERALIKALSLSNKKLIGTSLN